MPGVSEELRRDLTASVNDVASRGTIWDRSAEALSLAGLSLTLMARAGTGDDRGESIRQGVHLGVLATALILLPAAAADRHHLLVVMLGLLIPTLGSGEVLGARVLATGAAAVGVADDAGRWFTVLCLLALGTTLGRPHDGRRCVGGAVAAGVVASTLAAVGYARPDGVELLLVVGTAASVAGLVAAGWFDPRYAIAAAILCGVRLVQIGSDASGIGSVIEAMVEANAAGLGAAGTEWAVRVVAMTAGVGVSALVAAHSLRHRVGPLHVDLR